MKRGEIYTANLNPNRGAEIGKIRPVLILQADWLNAVNTIKTVIVLPLTSQVDPSCSILHPIVKARGQLKEDSQVVVEQPRTLDRRRLGQGPLATLSQLEMIAVEQSLLTILGLNIS